MEGAKIKKHKSVFPELNFENNENASQFYNFIKTEYLKNLYQTYFWIIFLIVIYVIIQLFLIPFNRTIQYFISDLVITWVLFSFYLFIHFYNLSYVRFMPTTINFLEKELDLLGYTMQRKYKIRSSNFLVICFSIIVFIFVNFDFYITNNFIINSLIIRFLIIYILVIISIPVIRGKLHDFFLVYLKNSYNVEIKLDLKLIKHKEVESQMVRIFMTSSKLCKKTDRMGYTLYDDITKKRWLKRKNNKIFLRILSKNYLFFHEYATLINFKEQFLNIVSAIREWDISDESVD